VLTIGLSTFNNAPHNRLWQDMASMVENMSSYFTAFADARGLQGSPPLVLPASFTPYQGFYPAPTAHGTIVSALRDSACYEEN
jgi:hypothetical protein